jgi:hypothetical protein
MPIICTGRRFEREIAGVWVDVVIQTLKTPTEIPVDKYGQNTQLNLELEIVSLCSQACLGCADRVCKRKNQQNH